VQMSTLGCWVTVYNEINRIKPFLRHASKWADEIVVVDKGSNDGTVETCKEAGCKVVNVSYSKQGQEDLEELFGAYKNNSTTAWALGLTASEVPTRNLMNSIREVIRSPQVAALHNILVPVNIYSFGIHSSNGPWPPGYQPRLLNTNRFRWRKRIHDHIVINQPPIAIRNDGDRYILHLTHPSFSKFAETHVSYAIQEAADSICLRERTRIAMESFEKFRLPSPSEVNETHRQVIGWKVYQLLTALACLDFEESKKTLDSYAHLRTSLIAKDWG